MDKARMLALAGVTLNEGNGVLGVPDLKGNKPLSQGKDPMTHMKPQAPAKIDGDKNTHLSGTGKAAKDPMSSKPQAPAVVPADKNTHLSGTGKAQKNPMREEVEALAAKIIGAVTALSQSLTEEADVKFADYRVDALKRIDALVSKYVD